MNHGPWTSSRNPPDFLKPDSFHHVLHDFGKPAQGNPGFLFPGMIDLHIHGAFGWDFSYGNPDRLEEMLDNLLTTGLTGVLATLITCSEEQRLKALHDIRIVAKRRRHPPIILGVHMEGPFLSAIRRGSHPIEFLMRPDLSAVKRWQDEAGGLIRMVTVAPELEGAFEFIKDLKIMGIKPAIGHTDADHQTTERAIQAGATHITHLFNAMRPFTHRNPTAVSAILSRSDTLVEMIGDGIHVSPEIAAMTFNLLDSRRIALVSDAMCPMGLPDGIHEAYGTQLELRDGRCTFDNGHLFGGGLSLLACLKTMYKNAKIPLLRLGESISRTPAKVLGLQVTDAAVFLDREFSWLATRWRDEWFWPDDRKA